DVAVHAGIDDLPGVDGVAARQVAHRAVRRHRGAAAGDQRDVARGVAGEGRPRREQQEGGPRRVARDHDLHPPPTPWLVWFCVSPESSPDSWSVAMSSALLTLGPSVRSHWLGSSLRLNSRIGWITRTMPPVSIRPSRSASSWPSSRFVMNTKF